MLEPQFSEILKHRIELIQSTLNSKAAEYAKVDRLYNFKRAACILNTTPQKALLGMLMKHIVSVIDLIESDELPERSLMEEKIGDSINYLILLEAIFREQMGAKTR